MTQLQTLIDEIPKYQPGADLDLLTRAYRFSEQSHQGQQRASGEPYLSHPLEVARLLVNFKMDVTTVTAGLLHDVLEDTHATKTDLQREFGAEIADLVDGVTKIGKLAFSSREERQAENYPQDARRDGARPARADDQARRPPAQHADARLPSAEKARKIAQETLDIYAPLAHRLGMAKVKAELEDLALVLEPGGLPGAHAPRRQAAPRARGGDQPAHRDPPRQARRGGHRVQDRRPAQALLLDLEEDARGRPRVRRDLRPAPRCACSPAPCATATARSA